MDPTSTKLISTNPTLILKPSSGDLTSLRTLSDDELLDRAEISKTQHDDQMMVHLYLELIDRYLHINNIPVNQKYHELIASIHNPEVFSACEEAADYSPAAAYLMASHYEKTSKGNDPLQHQKYLQKAAELNHPSAIRRLSYQY